MADHLAVPTRSLRKTTASRVVKMGIVKLSAVTVAMGVTLKA
jgi:hypothetical protein